MPADALSSSASYLNTSIPSNVIKMCSLGGGNAAGSWNLTRIQAINSAIQAGSFSAYQGLAYDIESGVPGLTLAFQESFSLAAAAGLEVHIMGSCCHACYRSALNTLFDY